MSRLQISTTHMAVLTRASILKKTRIKLSEWNANMNPITTVVAKSQVKLYPIIDGREDASSLSKSSEPTI